MGSMNQFVCAVAGFVARVGVQWDGCLTQPKVREAFSLPAWSPTWRHWLLLAPIPNACDRLPGENGFGERHRGGAEEVSVLAS
ncbi:hypothetical protein J2847_005831 [Azospirillum agricola]|nr:hypothetical protein [Azospirillum agricola]